MGEPVTESNRCPACGAAVHPGDRFCAVCGEQLGEPGFVRPVQANGERTGATWPGTAAASPADAAWMPPGRTASVTTTAGSVDGTEPTSPGVASRVERAPGTVTTAEPDAVVSGWGQRPEPANAATPIAVPAGPRGAKTDARPATAAGTDEDANWFVATRPSTLLAWGLIAVVGGLLLGAIGQVDPTDTLVILAFMIVPLGLLLLPLALLCWVVQKATGRR